MTSSYYTAYAQRASSWGYVVVQYDTPFFSLPSVIQEVRAFDPSLKKVTNKVLRVGHTLTPGLTLLLIPPTPPACSWMRTGRCMPGSRRRAAPRAAR